MVRFGLITEGVTDQIVIENIIEGVFGEDAEVNPLQPLGDETHRGQMQSFGGWLRVFEYCEAPDFEQAFQFNDYLIVQIDTDCCEEARYDISRQSPDGQPLCPTAMIERVHDKFNGLIGDRVWNEFGTRIIFAIAVDSVECWLLVLHAAERAKEKYLNCLPPLQQTLNRANIRVNLNSKNSRDYDRISADFRKRRILDTATRHNVGLSTFVAQLEGALHSPQAED